MRLPERERGAALLTVLLLVAIIAVIAAGALERLRVSTKLATNSGDVEQARAYAFAAETLATTRVTSLLGRDPSRVTLMGGWSGRAYPLPLPDGLATAAVTDGGNCFNLNGLVSRADGVLIARASATLQFARLLRLINVTDAERIAAAATDWIDSDQAPLPGGAEDESYDGYRTGNAMMADPSELRAVAGVTPANYAAVRPWLCTLPVAEPAVINVNTLAPEQAPLFAMLLPDTLGIEGARALLLRRPAMGYASTVAFWQAPALSGVTADPGAQAQTDVTTRWFALKVNVRLGDADVEERGLIDARRLPARLVMRQWGEDL